MTLQQVQNGTTSSEFVEWIKYLDSDANAFHREDVYLAQIAAEIRRGNVKNPRAVKTKDFILKFREEKSSPQDLKARQERSKSFWMAALGMKKEDHGI